MTKPIQTLSEMTEALRTMTSKVEGRGADYERYVHTLLGFMASMVARYPEGVTETTRIVCQNIAENVGSGASFKKG